MSGESSTYWQPLEINNNSPEAEQYKTRLIIYHLAAIKLVWESHTLLTMDAIYFSNKEDIGTIRKGVRIAPAPGPDTCSNTSLPQLTQLGSFDIISWHAAQSQVISLSHILFAFLEASQLLLSSTNKYQRILYKVIPKAQERYLG